MVPSRDVCDSPYRGVPSSQGRAMGTNAIDMEDEMGDAAAFRLTQCASSGG